MAKIHFHHPYKRSRLPKSAKLKSFIERIFEGERQGLERLDYIFCSDEYLLDINRSFLNHDYYTDIVTFDLSAASGSPIIGELYISIDRVVENAGLLNCDVQHELLRVIFHGSLHLCGYKDKTKSEITGIREREDYYLRLFALN
nr:rRNA maturation RNase YbeY [Segetibacter sp. 3557_3]